MSRQIRDDWKDFLYSVEPRSFEGELEKFLGTYGLDIKALNPDDMVRLRQVHVDIMNKKHKFVNEHPENRV